ncbi:MAG: DUF5110 domain-containing protein [Christensenellaceae bacterium]|jgi:alpha-glucosidase (family GH31 glycosyl hydrolase)|nr:DUF5110 domain-containing protein [Christensenellaceae bacterium]
MINLNDHLTVSLSSAANAKQTVIIGSARFSIITPILLRVEIAEDGVFTDGPTQIVWTRDVGEFPYTVTDSQKQILIKTDVVEFKFDKRKKSINYVVIDGTPLKCNNRKNLKGTKRTLDMSFGKEKLSDGIIGANGVSVMNDDSLLINEKGMITSSPKRNDKYIFASKNHKLTLNAFFRITGMPPMIPRYAVGNWWSRYHEYTQEEYLETMQRFSSEKIPFTVATIDMDWHWVDIAKEFGPSYKRVRGWTGYSWNTKLFPDYKTMFSELKSMGYRISLNLHPADGVRDYESMYREMCIETGRDPKGSETIEFDITDEQFINAYFKVLHNPYEADGLDVWWIDWQQGKKTKIKGYDPLWGLNHYHYLDKAKNGERPLILSRYAGLGSHRYPVGFSGDTAISWRVLDFQPYFTANAANAGYITWSHDIGGHHLGNPNDEELLLRWTQFGVFTPIMRLHSTKRIRGKEPWTFTNIYPELVRQLNFRHRLIPYIYTSYYQSYSEGKSICEPLYYNFPDYKESYEYKNEYYFGEKILVAPITKPSDKKTGLSTINVWLPEKKRYIDIFTNEIYEGGNVTSMTRDANSIPALVTEGAIIPFAVSDANECDNPNKLEIFVYVGNGTFELYEDDGCSDEYKNGAFAKTQYSVSLEDSSLMFNIAPAIGTTSFIPAQRSYEIFFKDLVGYRSAEVMANEKRIKYFADETSISVNNVKTSVTLKIILTDITIAPVKTAN